jgi:Zn-dependent membrane protease YugP
MTPVTVAKLTLALAGLLVFGYGVRADLPVIRWIGVGLVAVAVLLRFVPTRPPNG